jgi:acetyl esterase/lipase
MIGLARLSLTRIALFAGLVMLGSYWPMNPPKAELRMSQDRAERPEDVWGFLRVAADREGAAPDHTRTYTGLDGRTHRIEIFQPSSDAAENRSVYPGLVLFHGGAWREGSPVQFYRQARAVADAGIVVALPEYSLRDEDGTTPHDAVVDAFLAWQSIHAAANELAIAREHLFAGGASAGGQMAAALATLEPPDSITDHVCPAGLILFEPVVDNGPGGYGHALVRDYWEAFSPLHNIRDSHPDTLILVGDSDPLIPVPTAELYCQRVQAAGGRCLVEVFKDAGHAWFNYDPAGFSGTLAKALSTLQTWIRVPEDHGPACRPVRR